MKKVIEQLTKENDEIDLEKLIAALIHSEIEIGNLKEIIKGTTV